MNLSNVSRTAIFTLIMHDIMAKKKLIDDPLAALCLEKMIGLASEADLKQITGMKKYLSGIGYFDAVIPHCKRVKIIDSIAHGYISNNPGCTVVNLACGFDTRFWRVDNANCRYLEIDLPELIAIKKEILKENIRYELIGRSVLDYSWIDEITAKGNERFLIIAEGLLMYFNEDDGKNLSVLPASFSRSRLVFDMFPKYMTKGLWRALTLWSSKKIFGFNVSIDFGFARPNDIERISSGYKIIAVNKIDNRSVLHVSIN